MTNKEIEMYAQLGIDELQELLNQEHLSDDEIYKKLCTVEDFIEGVKCEMDLKDPINIKDANIVRVDGNAYHRFIQSVEHKLDNLDLDKQAIDSLRRLLPNNGFKIILGDKKRDEHDG